jgi:hypothetical protein
MSLFLATLLPGLALMGLGAVLALGGAGAAAMFRALPRSAMATYVLFGGAALWFLFNIWHLSPADFGEYRVLLFVGFALVAGLAFRCVPDFLGVRGLCALILLAASPLLDAAYMVYERPQRLVMVALVYVALTLAIWVGAQPWRLRDFLTWLFARPGRARFAGAALLGYGLLLLAVAFTY